MSEHLRPQSVERSHVGGEIEQAAAERLKHIEKSAERHEHKAESVETARERIHHVEVTPNPYEAVKKEPTAVLTKQASFDHTLRSLRHRMSPSARAFSQFIHQPTVEALSDVAGKTILRPSVTIGATTLAVLFSGFVYFSARHYGFELRGSEIWISLLAGGLLGLIIEFILNMHRRRNRI
ncbi:MAG TPA: hypothetical protein VLF21_02255 [Candidatus Saccharimonadales bacterium]|nr:hypothetical protein [Candidatus Saccharimonadales bacterium]